MGILTAIADKFEEILYDRYGHGVESTQVSVEHNVIKPDFSGDLYNASVTFDDGTTKNVSWTVGDNFKDDPSIVHEVAQKLADRILEDYAPAE